MSSNRPIIARIKEMMAEFLEHIEELGSNTPEDFETIAYWSGKHRALRDLLREIEPIEDHIND